MKLIDTGTMTYLCFKNESSGYEYRRLSNNPSYDGHLPDPTWEWKSIYREEPEWRPMGQGTTIWNELENGYIDLLSQAEEKGKSRHPRVKRRNKLAKDQ